MAWGGSLYSQMAQRDELRQAGGRTVDVAEMIGQVVNDWGVPAVVVADRWRFAEIADGLDSTGYPDVPVQVSPNPPNRVVRALERDLTKMETGASGGFWVDGSSSRPVAGERSRSCSGRRQQGTLAGRFVRREWEGPSTDW